jgi:hypothetical protein
MTATTAAPAADPGTAPDTPAAPDPRLAELAAWVSARRGQA